MYDALKVNSANLHNYMCMSLDKVSLTLNNTHGMFDRGFWIIFHPSKAKFISSGHPRKTIVSQSYDVSDAIDVVVRMLALYAGDQGSSPSHSTKSES